MRFDGGGYKPAHARNPLTGQTIEIWRKAHPSGGETKFQRCVGSRVRGHGGDIRTRTSNLASAAKACAGTRGH